MDQTQNAEMIEDRDHRSNHHPNHEPETGAGRVQGSIVGGYIGSEYKVISYINIYIY